MRQFERRLRKLESQLNPPAEEPVTFILTITKADGQVVPGLVLLIEGDNVRALEVVGAERTVRTV